MSTAVDENIKLVDKDKETHQHEITPKQSKIKIDNDVPKLLFSILKKVIVAAAIYLIYYMTWPITWFITPVILIAMYEHYYEKRRIKREVAKAFAKANEKDIILPHIKNLPAWVYFPDIERCEWINRILQQIWPDNSDFAKDLFKGKIEPKVAKSLSKKSLHGFKFDSVSLGTVPPRISGVKVYDKNTSRNEVIMDVDVFYAGDCDITFNLAGMSGGLKDFQVRGKVRVIMNPLIPKLPLVGGLQIFFLERPDIDFDLVGIAHLPGLTDILRRIIIDKIKARIVFPNKISIALNKKIPSIQLKMREPEGVLRIHIVEAKDLMKKDLSLFHEGKSDPYAIITVGSQQFRTQTIENTVNPKWDYWCEAYVDVKHSTNIEFQLFDWDLGNDPDPLGRATVDINNVMKNESQDTWITLEEATHGKLHVRFTWLELSSSASDLQAAKAEAQLLNVTTLKTAVLLVYLDSACDLPNISAENKPDPFAVLSVYNVNHKTPHKSKTDAPVWEKGYTFLVANPESDIFYIDIIDKKTEKNLGNFTYTLSSLLAENYLQIVSQPFQLKKSGPTSKVTLSLALKILKSSSNEQNKQKTKVIQREMSEPSEIDINVAKNLKVDEILSKYTQQSSDIANPPPVNSDSKSVINASVSAYIQEELSHTRKSAGELHRSRLSVQSLVGSYGLGRIQIGLIYSDQRQHLSITIHRVVNIPLKDPSNPPDSYVKLYLLPDRSKETKRKTIIVKDSCDPVYNVTFEYIISSPELKNTELEVTVATQKPFFSTESQIIGMVRLKLNDPEILTDGVNSFHELLPEFLIKSNKHDHQ